MDVMTPSLALEVYAGLQTACKALEAAGDHAIAAHVSYVMALVQERYGVGVDHIAASLG